MLLIRHITGLDNREFETGPGEISFKHSPHDPWDEIECVKPVTAYYSIGTNRLLPGAIVGEADPTAFLPYSFVRTDWGFEK